MKLLVLILLIQYVFGENLTDIEKLNEMEYSHEIKIVGLEAEFSFIIFNTSYAYDVLNISSYYFSITFVEEKSREERLEIQSLMTNETEFHARLKMENLEAEGNYLICVFFLNQTNLIGSSRFCHVVSMSDLCNLETPEATFNGQYALIILGFAVVLLIIIVAFTYIRDYIYRPRTIEAILKTLPAHHVENLETLAPAADDRRRRRTQEELSKRIRDDSIRTIDYNPNADNEYFNYHGIDNASLEISTA